MRPPRVITFIFVLLVLSTNGTAQAIHCITFDEPNTISQWESYNVQNVNIVNVGAPHGNVLQFTDGSGGSIVFNEGLKEGGLAGNWTGLYPCDDTLYFCFDYKVKWTGSSSPIPNSPKIWLYSGGPITSLADFNSRVKAFFEPNTTIPPIQANMENDVWRRFCFPIIMCTNGTLPSNQSGHWVVSVNSSTPVPDQCSAWNTIIQNITGVAFPSDYNAVPDEVVSVDNICWECNITPCDTAYPAIQLDTSCCTFTVPMSIAYDDLASIDYTVIGGLMSSLSVGGGCSATWTQTTSNTGTLHFDPFCDANSINVQADLLPLASPVSIAWTYHHMTGQICYDTTTVVCHVEVSARCDAIRTASIIDNTFPGRGKSVTIVNTKYPESPICRVRISMSPDPLPSEPNNKWLGGLHVNVTQPDQTQVPVLWPLNQSGTPFYSLIQFGTPAPMGPVVATNGLIEFQIGVNYTLNYQGSVTVVVEHCDGTTCDTTFPLCALQPAIACIPELATAPALQSLKLGVNGQLLAGVIGINAQISKMMNGDFSRGRDVRGVHITVVSPDAVEPPKIFAVGGDDLGASITGAQASLPSRIRIRNASIRGNAGLLTLSRGLTDKDTLPVPIVVLTGSSSNKVNVIYTLMLDNGDPLLSDTVRLDLTVSSVEFDGGARGLQPTMDVPLPMPASQDVVIRYWLPEASPCTIRLIDALGLPVRTIVSQDQPSGDHAQEFSVRDLPSGLYFINLLTPSASVSTKLNVTR